MPAQLIVAQLTYDTKKHSFKIILSFYDFLFAHLAALVISKLR